MNRITAEKISASKAIEHMKFRLSAEKESLTAIQSGKIEQTDRLLAHMRSRLKPESRLIYFQDLNFKLS